MNLKETLSKLQGIQTIESIMDLLHADRQKAIYYIHRLRKQGYVKTRRLSSKKRVYNISLENKLGGKSYYDLINENSPIKVAALNIHLIYGKEISAEETLVYVLKTGSLRVILAGIFLFKKITDWKKLYALAKENKLLRQVGALYDLARLLIKVSKMPLRFRNNSLPQPQQKYLEIIPQLRSRDFREIEKVWKVHLPFNKADLEVQP